MLRWLNFATMLYFQHFVYVSIKFVYVSIHLKIYIFYHMAKTFPPWRKLTAIWR